MRRALARLSVVAMVATFTLTGSPPAEAHQDACAGQGNIALTTSTFGYPLLSPTRTSQFVMSFDVVGTCAVSWNLFMTGVVTGSCGLATGTGVTDTGHAFSFTWVGGVWTLSGDVIGTLAVFSDFAHSGSCASGTASRFLTTGSLALVHVGTLLPPGGSAGPSALCTTGTIVNNTNPALTIRVQTAGTETWVCVRAGNYGGRLVIGSGGGGGPGVPVLPSTDSNVAACPSPTTGNIGDPGSPHYTEYLVGTMVSSPAVWVCARVNSTGVRVIVPVPGVPPVSLPTVVWQPDPGSPG